MGFNNFRFQIIFRLLVIFFLGIGSFYSAYALAYLITPIMLGSFAFIGILELIYYVEKTNRELTRFFRSIRFEDFTQVYEPTQKGQTFEALHESLNYVLNEFRKLRTSKEAHYQFLLTVFEQVDFPLICFEDDGKIQFVNKATLQFFKINSLKNVGDLEFPALKAFLFTLRAGERKTLSVSIHDNLYQLAGQAQKITQQGVSLTLASLQDISSALEEKEIEAWQTVIRVMAHEIMNSLTPIISLTQLTREKLEEETSLQKMSTEEISELTENVSTVETRSKGLLNFAQAYRSINHLPEPNFMTIPVGAMLKRTVHLMQSEISNPKLKLALSVNQEMEVSLDPELIEQVLINLIKNSVSATTEIEQPSVSIVAEKNLQNQLVISVEDNGKGIPQHLLSQIFIPFFTTKPHGSGIGLSLSRQIMKLHHGKIIVHSEEGKYTKFLLIF